MSDLITIPKSACSVKNWNKLIFDILESEAVPRHKTMTKRACAVVIQHVQVTPENINAVAEAVRSYCGVSVVETLKILGVTV